MEETTKNNYYFWEAVEDLAAQKIPNYIKNQLNLNGYGNISVFKDIKDDDIDGIEAYGRTQLVDLLNKKAENSGQQLDNDVLAAFFGIYSVCPQDFRFVTGDRKLINKLVVRVTEKLMENEGCKFFEQKSLARKRKCLLQNTAESVFGLIYGNFSRRPNMIGIADFRREDLKAKLFDQAKKMFDTHKTDEMTALKCQQFTVDSVDLDLSNDNNIKGTVVCAICQKKKLKVFLKTSGSTAYCWVMSNLKSHITTCLKQMHKNKSLPSNDKTTDLNGNAQAVTTLNITPVTDLDEMQSHLEDLVQNQISVQVVKMTNTVFQCKDSQQSMKCVLDPQKPSFNIKACDVSSDGDCFFAAATHQLKYIKIESAEHRKETENLRAATVKYIEENLEDFKHDLKNRLAESGQLIDGNNVDDQCLNFVRNHLAKPGYFAGRECFEAVSAIKKVNIVVFNEMGTCYFGSTFNSSYNAAILIAFRGSKNGQKNDRRNHFGSVAEIKTKPIENASQHLIENHMQYIRNKNRTSVISID